MSEALHQAALVEAWGDYVDPREYLTEDPSFMGYGVSTAPQSRIEDRADGRCVPYYETETDLALIRGRSRNLAGFDSVAIGARDARKHYVIGPGFDFKAQSENKDLAGAVQAVLDCFLDFNDFQSDLDLELFDRASDDGEPFLWLCWHQNKVVARVLEPDQITEPLAKRPIEDWLGCEDIVSSWSFGVHTDARFPQLPLGYHVIHDSRGNDWDYVPAAEMLHLKRNVPRNAKRGVSDYFPILADMRNEAKLATNVVTGAALQAAIAWVEEHPPGTKQEDVQALGRRLAETSTTQTTTNGNTQTRNVQRYRAGTILRPSPGRKYTPGPMGSERNVAFVEVAQFILRRIGVRWTMPEYMISGDASNANFASTLVSESPFVKARESDQRFFGSHFYRMAWKVLALYFKRGWFDRFGLTWELFEQQVDVDITPPSVATRDPYKLAQTQEIQKRMGILSNRTAATQASLDFDKELKNGAREAASMPSPFASTPASASEAALSAALESVSTTEEARAILEQLRPYP